MTKSSEQLRQAKSQDGNLCSQPSDAKLLKARSNYANDRERFRIYTPDVRTVSGADTFASGDRHLSSRFIFNDSELSSRGVRRFQPQLVEPLLQQAATFVNRVLADDPAYRQMLIDQANLALDLEEFQALDDINSDEVAAGLFNVPYWEAAVASESDSAFIAATRELDDWIASQSDDQKKYTTWSTENAQQPVQTGWENKLSSHTLKLLGGLDPTKLSIPGGIPNGYKGTEGFIVGGMLSYKIAEYSFNYQSQQLKAQMAPAARRSLFEDKKTCYYQADTGFRERRKIAAHHKLIRKLELIRLPNGPLNYAQRIREAEERAAVDLNEAYIRMLSVRDGLLILYGIAAPMLPRVRASANEPINVDLLNQMVMWLRSVSINTQDVLMLDQDYVYTISLKRVFGESEFRNGSRQRNWEFQLTPELFQGLKYLRLRGVSIETESSCDASFGFVLTPPQLAKYIYGSDGSAREIEQKVSDCWIGRARSHKSTTPPDIVGTRVLLNVSPVGVWQLRPAPGQNTNDATDIRINFYMAAQVA